MQSAESTICSSSLLFSPAVSVTDVTHGQVVKGVTFGDLISAQSNKSNSEIRATINVILLWNYLT
jgi:hypothetical protein